MNKVAVLIGSETDRDTIMAAKPYFEYFNIIWDLFVMSAHRNPAEVEEFSKNARDNGYKVIIGAAGMAAHLAGAIKANCTLPVVGVPLKGGMMDGMDALLSTVQMPKGVPVATMAVGKAGIINAAILSAEILSISDDSLVHKLANFKTAGSKL
ncbi:MAG: 5-(carboxyamino)imidazole ribonucleotide mutase [Candidatus Marinimicrobia bacterium]|jgi:5-(carboxyamino)imidazole ribonucleotide mutase|nr:5-(carboxyamino)imidazole ribonucleotide mutase [Candidatus Neomarinimicrobiota bacterium]MBT3634439.1 5-(carboxyamino)imidazole ribonucleotide mutase [Candidatus Neomarinimicrobiota bacterium]MBT3683266.1 5-(carboxyamino)imidazole ribonucleotide mutase [Candidatus Neomarinimicrobiota bacterium]MBT3760154.1 5-(carboxyamino)imidazole ribonucleotide mutase [Candidatus Neomarinimicrobiota bacterium]MBT3896249.1 5-(carboxyamino)imidazole ribonucleotide mutase [Candidatus Neomarinimicrobiota bact